MDRRAALSNARESVKARRRQESSSERKVKQLLVSDPYDDIEEAKIDTGDKVGRHGIGRIFGFHVIGHLIRLAHR